MSENFEKLSNISKNITLSRRNFLQAMATAGVGISIAGCSKNDDIFDRDDSIPDDQLANPNIYFAGCVHNCGTAIRCVSKIHEVNGRIVRVTTDDSDYAYDGSYRNKEQYNDSRALTCPKGRAYKYRVHHPGRLKYVLKQTKKRGDMSGFIRISPEQAMRELALKYRSVYEKYGPGAIHNIGGSSVVYGGTFSNPNQARNALTCVGSAKGGFADYSYHQYEYAYPLTGHPDILAVFDRVAENYHAIAGGAIKNIVSWGSNMLSTNNSSSYGYIKSLEYLKSNGGKAYFIGPELSDTGVVCHTDWLKIRNFTDTALICAMIYYMIDATIDEQGKIRQNNANKLDIDYIDTCVYGFFASPEYYVHTETGEIVMDKPVTDIEKYRHVEEVKPGYSFADYIMGSDDRLSKAFYDNRNYTSNKYSTKNYVRGGKVAWTIKGVAANTGDLSGNTSYQYKKDFYTAKTPEWASKITGVPVDKIVELAELYMNPESNIMTEWSGAFQKQENGVVNMFALASLLCICKTFGKWGGGITCSWASNITEGYGGQNLSGVVESDDFIDVSKIKAGNTGITLGKNEDVPKMSCTQWYNSIKLAYKEELASGGYTGKYIPNWDINGEDRYCNDEAGVKAGVKYLRNEDGSFKTYKGDDGLDYYDYEGRGSNNNGIDSTPVYTGTRLIISAGGAIPLNQHFNTNDTAEMYAALPLSGNPEDEKFADNFCLATFDVFMSPTARYADYVIPATIALEAADTMALGGENIYRPAIIKPKGDAKSGYEWAYIAYKEQASIGDFNATNTVIPPDAHLKFVSSENGEYRDIEEIGNQVVDEKINDSSSRFYGMTRQQVYANEYLPRKNAEEIKTSDPYKPTQPIMVGFPVYNNSGKIRKNLEMYLKSEDLKTKPFLFTTYGDGETFNEFTAWQHLIYTDFTCSDANVAGGIKNRADGDDRPDITGKMQVYNNTAVWDYEHLNSKYHGWLPAEKRGQLNKDFEGDKIVYPIPMYFNFEDCFKDAYDGFTGGKNESFFTDISTKGKPLTMGTTHDRFRVHSTHDENPLLRELTHRTYRGGWASGNDWQEYAVMPEVNSDNTLNISPMLSSAIYNKNIKTASWHDIWINTEDAKERGIQDGDLCIVENPIGKVRVIARVTDRCIKGHINLHQGGWYDPNPEDNIDDGGCANTLMSSKPSRYDRGNAQQCAYVKIYKTSFKFQ